MELPKDPVMLLSVINTELRDKYPSLYARKNTEEKNQHKQAGPRLSASHPWGVR